jgi:hypothetical protein
LSLALAPVIVRRRERRFELPRREGKKCGAADELLRPFDRIR